MGQKANPISTRLGINQKWSSTWFPKKGQYAANLKLDLAIRKYLEEQFKGKSVFLFYCFLFRNRVIVFSSIIKFMK